MNRLFSKLLFLNVDTGGRCRRIFKTFASAFAALIVGILAAEALLRLACFIAPDMDELINPPPVVKDPLLEYRFRRDMDSSATAKVRYASKQYMKIAAIGDSITFGSGVIRGESWPDLLQNFSSGEVSEDFVRMAQNSASRAGQPTPVSLTSQASHARPSLRSINFSCPGYGPVHYVWLQEKALKMCPDVIVCTFYTGNDLFDAFHLVDLYHFTGQIETPPHDWPLERTLNQLRSRRMGTNSADLSHAVIPANGDMLKIFGLVRSVYTMAEYKFGSLPGNAPGDKIFKNLIYMSAALSSDSWFFDDGASCTTFSFKSVLRGLNLEDEWVRTGLRLSMEAYGLMQRNAEKAGIPFYVLVIPTKHTVFRDSVTRDRTAGSAIPVDYLKILEHESRVRKAALEFFNKNGISYIDALPALEESLRQGCWPYKISVDNHPNAYGQAVIAGVVLRTIYEHSDGIRFPGSQFQPGEKISGDPGESFASSHEAASILERDSLRY